MELGWSEILVIGLVALIVIGPKDLPEMFRTLGRFTAKMRSMAREFSRAMEDAANESGVKDVADDLRKVANPKSMGIDAVKSAADRFEKWDPMKAAKAAVDTAAPSAAPSVPASSASATAGTTGPAVAASAAGVVSAAASAGVVGENTIKDLVPTESAAQAPAETVAAVAKDYTPYVPPITFSPGADAIEEIFANPGAVVRGGRLRSEQPTSVAKPEPTASAKLPPAAAEDDASKDDISRDPA